MHNFLSGVNPMTSSRNCTLQQSSVHAQFVLQHAHVAEPLLRNLQSVIGKRMLGLQAGISDCVSSYGQHCESQFE